MAWLVYDDGCGLCRRSVAWVCRRGGARSPLPVAASVATAQGALPAGADPSTSVLWVEEGRVLRESVAVVRVLRSLRAPWPVLGLMLWLVPRPVRDGGYRWVARNRGRFGGGPGT